MAGFLSTLVSGVIAGGIVSFLNYRFLRRTAVLKTDLDKDLEKFKATLSAELFARQTTYAWLHAERSRVLLELYRLLKITHREFTSLLLPVQMDGSPEAEQQRLRAAVVALGKVVGEFEENEVLLDFVLGTLFQEMLGSYKELYIRSHRAVDEMQPGTLEKGMTLGRAWEDLDGKTARLLKTLEGEIQRILGVEKLPTPA